jgi:hypothetical protein
MENRENHPMKLPIAEEIIFDFDMGKTPVAPIIPIQLRIRGKSSIFFNIGAKHEI